jgi:queuosine precursor transporter
MGHAEEGLRLLTLLYVLAPAAANLIIGHYGPEAVPAVSFFLVGLVITTRDILHERWRGNHLTAKMAAAIMAGGLLSVAANPGVVRIAIASVVAFIVSEAVNALVYEPMLRRGVPFLGRVNAGNVANAALDSALFVTLAFGFAPWIIAVQIVAKVGGGFLWSLVYAATRRERAVA